MSAHGRDAALWKFNPRDQTFTFYPKPQPAAGTAKIQITREGAVWYSPRGSPGSQSLIFSD
jgi:streptogramin lyase